MSRFKTLSRRTFLGGAGVMVGLPMLEAMIPTRKAEAGGVTPVQRLLCWYVPNGIHMQAWTPAETGAGYALTPILQPLAALKSEVLVISGLDNNPAESEGPGDHASGTSGFLTCTHVTKSESVITNGTSVDQIYAQHLAGQTVIPSLQLGIDGGGNSGGCDSGYSCAYSRNISWVGNTPLSKLTSPVTTFDLLFAGFDPGATAQELEQRKTNRLSVLDYTLADAEKLRLRLGTSDKIKLDEYLDSVRDLELKVQTDDTAPACELGEAPGEPGDVTNHIHLMCDVMVKAFECDRTRVITFMAANAGNNRSYGFLGHPNGHHQYSHHNSDPVNFAALQAIDTWEVEQFAYLLQRMSSISEPDGTTLLDSAMVYFSSEIEDGNAHRHGNLPVLLAGRGGGVVSPGRHVIHTDVPMANLFLAMLQGLGVDTNSFGDDSSGVLPLV
ncbi:DUF1552 domain-containing protein [Paraliomyxa miuraensis]|uniref:DUF1552 domain-containing protein n=1 Tax=Paraliomyxa miuraensis TaxID=376150 RepID=UPI00225B4E5A|nr:DUF1552 domain-containing protein [Paraliomyxa miuraensis]MCX4240640.1 DUF1552 domain-containing protein [Paraliomyxa miuraensis]